MGFFRACGGTEVSQSKQTKCPGLIKEREGGKSVGCERAGPAGQEGLSLARGVRVQEGNRCLIGEGDDPVKKGLAGGLNVDYRKKSRGILSKETNGKRGTSPSFS